MMIVSSNPSYHRFSHKAIHTLKMREFAKFLSGLTLWPVFAQSTWSVCDVLPSEWRIFPLIALFNAVPIVVPIIISGLLIWFGWFKNNLKVLR